MTRLNVLFLLIFSLGLVNCSKEEKEIKVSEITVKNIDEEGLSISLDSTFQVEAFTAPQNANRGNITYKSSNETIFTVSSKGLIQPKKAGEAILTIKTQDGTYLRIDRKVVITPPIIHIKAIEIEDLTDGYLNIPLNVERQVRVKLTPADSDPLLEYKSSNPAVFTIDENGRIKGLTNEGEAELTVSSKRDPGIKATCLVKVLNLTVEDIIVPAGKITLRQMGETYNLKSQIQILPASASAAILDFQSSNSGIVSVSADGILTVMGRGDATITIRSVGDSPVEKTVDVRAEAELSYDGWAVTASSYNASQGTPEAILVDGASPFWHSKWEGGAAPLPHWLLIDMKKEQMITEFLIERRGTNTDLRKAFVEISKDGNTFTQVGILDWGSSPASDNLRSAAFSKQKVQYIRITVTESNRAPNASINRVRVYGASE